MKVEIMLSQEQMDALKDIVREKTYKEIVDKVVEEVKREISTVEHAKKFRMDESLSELANSIVGVVKNHIFDDCFGGGGDQRFFLEKCAEEFGKSLTDEQVKQVVMQLLINKDKR